MIESITYDTSDAFGTNLVPGWKDNCEQVNDLYAEVIHIRRKKHTQRWMEYRRGKSRWEPARYGGLTVCHIRDEAGHLLSSGFSLCQRCDQYDYEDGKNRAIQRALWGAVGAKMAFPDAGACCHAA